MSVGLAYGSSEALGVGATGYQVGWVRLAHPAIGYEVAWVRLCVPYAVTQIVVQPLVLVSGSGDGARAKRPIVDDRNDLQDLCDIWELMMRKAA